MKHFPVVNQELPWYNATSVGPSLRYGLTVKRIEWSCISAETPLQTKLLHPALPAFIMAVDSSAASCCGQTSGTGGCYDYTGYLSGFKVPSVAGQSGAFKRIWR